MPLTSIEDVTPSRPMPTAFPTMPTFESGSPTSSVLSRLGYGRMPLPGFSVECPPTASARIMTVCYAGLSGYAAHGSTSRWLLSGLTAPFPRPIRLISPPLRRPLPPARLAGLSAAAHPRTSLPPMLRSACATWRRRAGPRLRRRLALRMSRGRSRRNSRTGSERRPSRARTRRARRRRKRRSRRRCVKTRRRSGRAVPDQRGAGQASSPWSGTPTHIPRGIRGCDELRFDSPHLERTAPICRCYTVAAGGSAKTTAVTTRSSLPTTTVRTAASASTESAHTTTPDRRD
jgi:hypothetical protein